MKKISKALLSIVLTSTIAVTEVSAAPRAQLDVVFYKDGHEITTKRSYISDELFGQQPSAMSSGTEVGYETCTKDGPTTRVRSESVFVGHAIFIKPVAIDGEKARLSVSVLDTEFAGKHHVGPSDCRSEVVDVRGLDVKDVGVDVANGQTVEVPLGDVRYRLLLKLRNEDL
jgi:hypothetical protein